MTFVNFILRILIGGLFIFSGLSKLFPIELFEFDLIEMGVINWTLAPYFSRLLIALELLLGVLFLLNWKPKKFTYPVALLVLIIFTGFLIHRLLTGHATENCGCFGIWLPMSVQSSIIKNLVTGVFICFLFLKNSSQLKFKKEKLWVSLVFACITSAIFAFRIPDDFYLKEEKPPLENNTINPEIFPYVNVGQDSIKPTGDKLFLVFFSLTCDHCLKAARKLSIIQKQNPEFKMLAYLNGEKKDLVHFLQETKLSLPYTLFNKRDFIFITQGSVPKIYLTKDLRITNYWVGEDFTEKELQDAWKAT